MTLIRINLNLPHASQPRFCLLGHAQPAKKCLLYEMQDAPPELFDDQLLQLLQLHILNMLKQVLSAGNSAAILQGKVSESRVLVKQQKLQLLDASILCSHHILVADGLRVVIADGKDHVELEQVHQLAKQLACKWPSLSASILDNYQGY